jgi:glycosyltransferase involved in cell wall biosynthesis
MSPACASEAVCRAAHSASVVPGARTRIRVMHLVSTLNIGGLEKVVYDLARRVDPGYFDVQVLCLGEIGMVAADFGRAGVRVEGLEVLGAGFVTSVLRVSERLRAIRPTVLHTHNPAPHVVGAAAAALSGVPALVHTKHGRNYPEVKLKVLANRLAGLLTDFLVAVSDDAGLVATKVELIPHRKVRIIRNGVDLQAFVPAEAGSASGPPRVIHLARLVHPTKDQETLLRAVRIVADSDPGFVLGIVGDGPHRPALEALADHLDLRRHVVFNGFRDDVGRVLRDAALFVLSSESEGLSVTLLEAMATGLPVVATDVGGNREVVAHGRTGLLVPARSPSKLAQASLDLLRDPARRGTMGREGRRRIEEESSLSATITRYEELNRLAAQRGTRGPRNRRQTAAAGRIGTDNWGDLASVRHVRPRRASGRRNFALPSDASSTPSA